MHEHELPTWNHIADQTLTRLDGARTQLSDARDWLNSDWRPLGSPLTDEAARARSEVLDLIGQAKGLIDQAKGLMYDARRGT